MLTGLVVFVIAEKLFAPSDNEEEDEEEEESNAENVPVVFTVTQKKESSSTENNNNNNLLEEKEPLANGKAKMVNGHVSNGSVSNSQAQAKNGSKPKLGGKQVLHLFTFRFSDDVNFIL